MTDTWIKLLIVLFLLWLGFAIMLRPLTHSAVGNQVRRITRHLLRLTWKGVCAMQQGIERILRRIFSV
jgi:hypothetical protein